MNCRRAELVVGLGLAALAAPLRAQTDYHNLERHRPLRVEDAYPVERGVADLAAGYAARVEGQEWRMYVLTDVAWGFAPDAHLGFSGTYPFEADGFEFDVFGFYNVNTEGRALPALSLRGDVVVPERAAAVGEVSAIATRSFGRTRVHANGGTGIGVTTTTTVDVPRWWAGAALDYTLFRGSLLLGGEVFTAEDGAGASGVVGGLGLRWQWLPLGVLDFGVSRRLSTAGPDLALTLGLSGPVAFPGLIPPRRGGRGGEHYQAGRFNWKFLSRYPDAARLFNAFDYGHAVLYERLYAVTDSAAQDAALARDYRYLTTDLLVRPPRFGVAEEAIAPEYSKLAWRAVRVFDWVHQLHRQIYDVYADDRLSDRDKMERVERLTDGYLARRALALAPAPKSMALMDEQYYSLAFRRRHPAFNELIWAYHWFQVGLYEPLIAGASARERELGVAAATTRFRAMLADSAVMPQVMPLTVGIAPAFTARHPRAAAIFDNLHMLHDVISDILASPTVPRERKREVIYAALDEFQDPSRNVIERAEWAEMVHHMGGVEAMGGAVPRP